MKKKTTYSTKLREVARNLVMLRDREKRTGEILLQVSKGLSDMEYHASCIRLSEEEIPKIKPWLLEAQTKIALAYKKVLEAEAHLDFVSRDMLQEDRLGSLLERSLDEEADITKRLIMIGERKPEMRKHIAAVLDYMKK